MLMTPMWLCQFVMLCECMWQFQKDYCPVYDNLSDILFLNKKLRRSIFPLQIQMTTDLSTGYEASRTHCDIFIIENSRWLIWSKLYNYNYNFSFFYLNLNCILFMFIYTQAFSCYICHIKKPTHRQLKQCPWTVDKHFGDLCVQSAAHIT